LLLAIEQAVDNEGIRQRMLRLSARSCNAGTVLTLLVQCTNIPH